MERRRDLPQMIFAATGTVAFFFLPLVEVKPNRIASGVRYTAPQFLGWPAFLSGFLFLLVFILLGGKRQRKAKGAILLTFLAWGILLLLLALGRPSAIPGEGAQRITLSSGLYLLLLSSGLLLGLSADEGPGEKRTFRLAFGVVLLLLLGLLLRGDFNAFSLVKEFRIKQGQFSQSLATHFFLAFGSVLAGFLVAAPLGYVAYRRRSFESGIMVPLSIVETIPSLSLFGILLVPLSFLGKLPLFQGLGISGIGWAPAFVALSLYSLLPMARNTLVGFTAIDRSVVEAAQGMGMTSGEILRKIELPLAFPLILTGVRISLVQAFGGAVLAGLVGGGGLGTFVFLGLAEASPDLILLGVIPIVVITLVMDHIMKKLIEALRRNEA